MGREAISMEQLPNSQVQLLPSPMEWLLRKKDKQKTMIVF